MKLWIRGSQVFLAAGCINGPCGLQMARGPPFQKWIWCSWKVLFLVLWQALESLVCIMRLMGPKHITGVRVKIMTTLKIGLRYKDHGFQLLSCRAWDSYVRRSVHLAAFTWNSVALYNVVQQGFQPRKKWENLIFFLSQGKAKEYQKIPQIRKIQAIWLT